MLRIPKEALTMGACNSKMTTYTTTPPPLQAAARERLENQTYGKWKVFAQDVLLGYGNSRIKFRVQLDLLLVHYDGSEKLITHVITYNDLVHTLSLNYCVMQLRAYMGAPYYLVNGQYLHFYDHVRCCKLVYIKNFCLE